MASYVPAKYGTEYIFYVGLESVATAGTFQANATLASGDVKLSKNGGTLTNLTTLPTVTPASGKLIKVTLSATEMECDNATVVFSDASGNEWRDLIVNIQTAARQIDDLAYPTTSGRSIDVTTTGEVGIDWGNIGSPTTSVNLSGTTAGLIDSAITAAKIASDAITAAKIADGAIDAATFAAGAINAAAIATDAIDADALAADAASEIQSGLATAIALTTLTGYVDTEVAAIKAKTDNLPASPAATGDIPSASSIASAVLSAIMEGSTTVVQGLRIMLSVLAGKSTGGGTTGVAFRDLADSKNRVSATVDADGNRTATTLDGS